MSRRISPLAFLGTAHRYFSLKNTPERQTSKSTRRIAKAARAAIEQLENRTLLVATLYWDPSGTKSMSGGGSGTWDTSSAVWYNQTSGIDVAWSSVAGQQAIFPAGSGSVTISTPVNAVSVTFNSSGYSVGGIDTTSGTLTLLSGQQVNVASGVAATISAVIKGSVGLTKTGGGTLTLAGANSYTTQTTISAGVLQLSGSATLGAISNTLSLSGSGTLDLNGVNATVKSISGSSSTILNNGTAATINVAMSGLGATYSGNLTDGTGMLSLAMSGASTQVFTGTNAYSGTTTIGSGATFRVSRPFGAGAIVNNGTFSITTSLTGTLTFPNAISGTGSLSVSSPTTTINTFTGSNSFSGGTNISSGIVTLTGSGQLGAVSGPMTIAASGILDLNGVNFSCGILNNSGVIRDGTSSSATPATVTTLGGGTISGVMQNPYGKLSGATSGSGTLKLSTSVDLNFQPVDNGYNFCIPWTIGVGTTLSGLYFSSGSLTYPIVDNGTLFIQVPLAPSPPAPPFLPAISGSGNVTLSADGGNLFVSGSSTTYTGTTTVQNGNVQLRQPLSSSVIVKNSANLDDATTGTTVGGSISVLSSGTLSPGGASPGLLATTNLSLASGGNLNLTINSSMEGTGYDHLVVTGNVSLGNAYLNLNSTRGNHDGDQLTIIDNQGSSPVSGTFYNLPEGSRVSVYGVTYILSYQGGTGNDVVLLDTSPPAALNDNYVVTENNTLIVSSVAQGVLNNDAHDPGTSLVVYSVNGSTSAVNEAVSTGHGGTLKLNSNGTLTYVPDPDFVGTDSATVYIASDSYALSNQATVQFVVNPGALHGTGSNFTAPEGAYTTFTVANITDESEDAVNRYVATVHWGDGKPDSGAVAVADGHGGWNIVASHTYDEQGTFTASAVVSTNQGATPITLTSTGTITPSVPVVAGGYTLIAVEGTDSRVQTVATFTAAGSDVTVNNCAAYIDWGDVPNAPPENAHINYDPSTGIFTVLAHHLYAVGGSYSVHVTISHDGMYASPASTVSSALVANASDAEEALFSDNFNYVGAPGLSSDINVNPSQRESGISLLAAGPISYQYTQSEGVEEGQVQLSANATQQLLLVPNYNAGYTNVFVSPEHNFNEPGPLDELSIQADVMPMGKWTNSEDFENNYYAAIIFGANSSAVDSTEGYNPESDGVQVRVQHGTADHLYITMYQDGVLLPYATATCAGDWHSYHQISIRAWNFYSFGNVPMFGGGYSLIADVYVDGNKVINSQYITPLTNDYIKLEAAKSPVGAYGPSRFDNLLVKNSIDGGTYYASPDYIVPSLIGNASVNEGQSYSINISASGAGASSITGWTVNWGDGTSDHYDTTASSLAPQHTYILPNNSGATYTYHPYVTAYTLLGEYLSNQLPITVHDVLPGVAVVLNGSSATAGSTTTIGSATSLVTLSATLTTFEPLSAGFSYRWTVKHNGLTLAADTNTLADFSPTLGDDPSQYGIWQIQLKVTDPHGGSVNYASNIAVANSAMVGQWLLDGSGATASDSTDQGRDGIVVGAQQWQQNFFGDALRFTGPGDTFYASLTGSGSSPIPAGTPFTISWWLSAAALSYDGNLIDDFTHGSDTFAFRSFPDGSYEAGTKSTQIYVPAAAGSVITPGEWQQFAYVYDGQNGTLYHNGAVVGQQQMLSPESWTGLYISKAEGTFSDLELYASARSAVQVADNYNQGANIQAVLSAYSTVYNNIKYEPYRLSKKSPEATLETKLGNDIDQDLLFRDLIVGRSINDAQFKISSNSGSGHLADIYLPEGDVERWLGVQDRTAAVNILSQAGLYDFAIPGEIALYHFWASVSLPTPQGTHWFDFDPSWKFQDLPVTAQSNSYVSAEPSYDSSAYLQTGDSTSSPLEWFQKNLDSVLNDNAISIPDIFYSGNIHQETFDAVPQIPWLTHSIINQREDFSGAATLDQLSKTAEIYLKYATLNPDNTINTDNVALHWTDVLSTDGLTSLQIRFDGDPTNAQNVIPRLYGVRWVGGTGIGVLLSEGTSISKDPQQVQPYIEIDETKTADGTVSQKLFKRDVSKDLSIVFDESQFSDSFILSVQAQVAAWIRGGTAADMSSLRTAEGALVEMQFFNDLQKDTRTIAGLSHMIPINGGIGVGINTAAFVVTPTSAQLDISNPYAPANSIVDNAVSTYLWPIAGGFNDTTMRAANIFEGDEFSWRESTSVQKITNTLAVSTISGIEDAIAEAKPVYRFYPDANQVKYVNLSDPAATPESVTGTQFMSLLADLSNVTLASSDGTQNISASETLYRKIFGHSSDVPGDTPAPNPFEIVVPKDLVEYDGNGNVLWKGLVYIAKRTGEIDQYELDYQITPTETNIPSNGSASRSQVQPTPIFPTNGPLVQNTGDPVNISNGNLTDDETDISISEIGMPLTFSRHYDSDPQKTGAATRDRGMGNGWSFSFSDFVELDGGGRPTWHTSDGQDIAFDVPAAGSSIYHNPAYVHGTFIFSGNIFTYTGLDGTTTTFDQTGRLMSIVDRNGHGYAVTYLSGRNIDRVTYLQDANRYLQFTYTNNHITQITDFLGRVWDYGYSAGTSALGMLTDVKAPAAATHLDSQNGDTPTGAERLEVTYDYYPESPGNQGRENKLHRIAMVQTGVIHDYDYYINGRALRTTAYPQGLSGAKETEYFDYYLLAGNYATTHVDPLGRSTIYRFNENGLTTLIVNPDGSRSRNVWGTTASPTGADETFDLKSKTDEVGRVTAYGYFANGDIYRVTGGDGVTTEYSYNLAGNGVSKSLIRFPMYQLLSESGYDSVGNLIWTTNANGQPTTMTYYTDAARQGLLKTITQPLGNFDPVTNAWATAAGNYVAYDDGSGNLKYTTTYSDYDSFGFPETVSQDVESVSANLQTDAAEPPAVTHTSYSAYGYLLTTTDASGITVVHHPSILGADLGITYPTPTIVGGSGTDEADNQPLKSYSDYEGGRVSSTTGPTGIITSYHYDEDGRLSSTESQGHPITIGSPLHMTQTSVFDADGNVIEAIDSSGQATHFIYDLLNRRVATIYADGAINYVRLDGAGRVIYATDALGNTAHTSYDFDDRPVSVTNAAGEITTYQYLGALGAAVYGRLTRQSVVTAPSRGPVNTITDEIGRVTKVIAPSDQHLETTTIYYDDLRNGTNLRNEVEVDAHDTTSGAVHAHRYTETFSDALGRADVQVNASAGDPVSWAGGVPPLSSVSTARHDAAGRVISTTDENGNTTTSEYDGAGRLYKVTQPDPDEFVAAGRGNGPLAAPVTTYTYNADGQVATQNTTLGTLDGNFNFVKYEYDELGRKVKDTDAFLNSNVYAYDSANHVVEITDKLGHITFSGYDVRGRVVFQQLPTADSADPTRVAFSREVYDANGNVIASISLTGDDTTETTTTAYDSVNRAIKIIGPFLEGSNQNDAKTVTNWFYNGNLIQSRDSSGTTDYWYDNAGRTIQQHREESSESYELRTNYTFDGFGDEISIQDPKGNITTIEYDELGRKIKETNPSSVGTSVTQYGYDPLGNIVYTIDPIGSQIMASHGLTFAAMAVGHIYTTTYAYDRLNHKISEIDPDPDYQADSLSGVLTNGNKPSALVLTDFDGAGNLIRRIDTNTGFPVASTNQTTYTYDSLNRLTSETTPTGNPYFWYDAVGNLIAKVDRDGRIFGYTYDGRNEEIHESWYQGGTVNASGQPVGGTLLKTLTWGYDIGGRQVSASDPQTATDTYLYDAAGNVVKNRQTSADGAAVELTSVYNDSYDRTQLSANIYLQTSPTTAIQDFLNRYQYNSRDLVTSILQGTSVGTRVPNKLLAYDYDANGNIVSLERFSDLKGSTSVAKTQYFYSDGNQLNSIYQFQGYQEQDVSEYSYSFDADGWVKRAIMADNRYVDYLYDSTGQLLSAAETSSVAQNAQSYDYDPQGNRTTADGQTYGAATSENRLTTDGTYSYTYDNEGNLLTRTNSVTGQVRTFTYDYRNRLLSVDDSQGNAPTVTAYSTGEEAVGGLDSHWTVNGVSAHLTTHDSAWLPPVSESSYISWDTDNTSGSVTTYYYSTNIVVGNDAPLSNLNMSASVLMDDELSDVLVNGISTGIQVSTDGFRTAHTVSIPSSFFATGTNTVTFVVEDSGNYVTGLDVKWLGLEPPAHERYGYDTSNRRVSKSVSHDNGTTYQLTERYFYDGNDLVLTTDATGNVLQRYLWGPVATEGGSQELPLASDTGTTQSVQWYLHDRQGNVSDVLDASGATVDHLIYDSYGQVKSDSNPSLSPRFGYGGMVHDRTTGMYYANARYYDPQVGRFISQDPMGFGAGDANVYRYVGNNATNLTDPGGMNPTDLWTGAIHYTPSRSAPFIGNALASASKTPLTISEQAISDSYRVPLDDPWTEDVRRYRDKVEDATTVFLQDQAEADAAENTRVAHEIFLSNDADKYDHDNPLPAWADFGVNVVPTLAYTNPFGYIVGPVVNGVGAGYERHLDGQDLYHSVRGGVGDATGLTTAVRGWRDEDLGEFLFGGVQAVGTVWGASEYLRGPGIINVGPTLGEATSASVRYAAAKADAIAPYFNPGNYSLSFDNTVLGTAGGNIRIGFNAAESATPGTFASMMDPAEAARWNDHWGGYSAYQRDISGAAPFGLKTAFTLSGEIKTVTTFDQYGRPYMQYGLNEGEPFHYHDFTYPTNSMPGTGWTPIRNPGVPIK